MVLVTVTEDFEDGTLGGPPVLPYGVFDDGYVRCFADPAIGSLSGGVSTSGPFATADINARFFEEVEVPGEGPPGWPWTSLADAYADYFVAFFATQEDFEAFLISALGVADIDVLNAAVAPTPTTTEVEYPIKRVAQSCAVLYSDVSLGNGFNTALTALLADQPDGDPYLYGIRWTDEGFFGTGDHHAHLYFWRLSESGGELVDIGYDVAEGEWLRCQIEHVGTSLVLTVWGADGSTVIGQQTWSIGGAAWIQMTGHTMTDVTRTMTGLWIDNIEWVYEKPGDVRGWQIGSVAM